MLMIFGWAKAVAIFIEMLLEARQHPPHPMFEIVDEFKLTNMLFNAKFELA